MERDLELTLVEGLRGGDPAAFDVVYEAYRARLYGFLVRLSGRREVADDLLEETWLRLVAKAGSLRPETQLAPWLFTVARNLYWSYCRSRMVEQEHGGLLDLWPAPPAPASPFEETALRELEGRVERAMTRLPARDREVLLLVTVDGLTPSEAAAVCGVSPEALRQRLSRARALLNRLLADTGRASRPATREALS